MSKKNSLKEIITVAQKLFFEYDYDTVSMGDIAKSSKITKAALYYHFTSKQDLYLHIINKNFSDFKENIESLMNEKSYLKFNVEDKVKKVLVFYFDFIVGRVGFLKVMAKKVTKNDKEMIKFFAKGRENILEILKPLSEEIIKYKKMKSDVSHKNVSMMLMSTVNPFVHEYAMGVNKKINPEFVAKQICSFIFSK